MKRLLSTCLCLMYGTKKERKIARACACACVCMFVLMCSSNWPGTPYVYQALNAQRFLCLCLLGLKACSIKAPLKISFFKKGNKKK